MTKQPETTTLYLLVDFAVNQLVGVYLDADSAKLAGENTSAYVEVVEVEAQEVKR